jgi:hypothetical protein
MAKRKVRCESGLSFVHLLTIVVIVGVMAVLVIPRYVRPTGLEESIGASPSPSAESPRESSEASRRRKARAAGFGRLVGFFDEDLGLEK